MRLKTKKHVNGKNVVIIDTGSAGIDEIVGTLADGGWQFPVLQASYPAKDGTVKKKDIPARYCAEVQKKYNIAQWAFKTERGAKTLVVQVDNQKRIAVVSRSTGGAIQDLLALPIGSTPDIEPGRIPTENTAAAVRSDEVVPIPSGEITTTVMTEQPISPLIAAERAAAADQAAAAIYTSDPAGTLTITPEQKVARRASVRKDDKKRAKKAATKKSKVILALAIVELFTVAGTVFGAFGLWNAVQSRRKTVSDPTESMKLARDARVHVILGMIAVLAVPVSYLLARYVV